MKAENDFNYAAVDNIYDTWKAQKGALIPMLQEIQHEFGYLPRTALEYLSKKLNQPISQIYGVCTFYSQFHLKPRGQHIIRVCQGTACHVRGIAKIATALEEEIQVPVGDTTEDLLFTYESVACVGCCGLAPVMMIDDVTYGRLIATAVPDILKKYERGEDNDS